MREPKKICFVSSSGGHLEELMCLKPIAEKHYSFLVTEKNGNDVPSCFRETYYVNQINRKEPHFLLHFLKLFGESRKILKQENPDIIISTGALAACPICILAKLKSKKVIFIESFARVKAPSLSGKIMYKFADKFIVQWPDLLEACPKGEYYGGLF